MAITRNDMIIRVADLLSVSAIGQALSSDDAAKIGQWYDMTLDYWSARGMTYVGDADDVPQELVLPLARAAAVEAAPAFGIPRAEMLTRLGKREQDVKTDMLAIIGDGPTGEVARATYY